MNSTSSKFLIPCFFLVLLGVVLVVFVIAFADKLFTKSQTDLLNIEKIGDRPQSYIQDQTNFFN
ncbi:hypothetical protein D6810_00480 [Candidatus Dojkabacteria bacterium]|uniref:Uncharacterized protein n=1 Tax=Candidatus Dojkabacteria bacterium TaxID=2099670 RepID=A0A3M0Z1I0_9BACT|nr:MAG: hypothetical protein D6810_00480 [Candidatus Dojkabacteria bacterium]